MKSASRPECRRSFILSSFFFILFLCVLASINEFRFDSLLKFGQCALSNTPSSNNSSSESHPPSVNSSPDDIRILIGILTLPDQYNRRHFLRLIYGTQNPAGARVDVKFVFCNLTKEDQKVRNTIITMLKTLLRLCLRNKFFKSKKCFLAKISF